LGKKFFVEFILEEAAEFVIAVGELRCPNLAEALA
jgi:hypothetical protein